MAETGDQRCQDHDVGPEQSERHPPMSRECRPLPAKMTTGSVRPAARAIATMVRCGALLVSVCHVKKKPAWASGSER